ncbi:MAG: hypothetical protein FWD26_04110 [Treponema sp.]|nr:hypothetical protein [Treponema sp.]
MKKLIAVLLFFTCLQYIYTLETEEEFSEENTDIESSCKINITLKQIEGYFRGEHTRGNDFLYELSAIGAIELESKYLFRGGLSFGWTLSDLEVNTFIGTAYSPFAKIPLSFSVSYIYNGLPVYENHTHSILPFISYHAKRAGISLGANFRFTRFFGEKAQFETVLSFYTYLNFVNNETLRIGIGCGNFNDFYAKNLGALFLNVYASIRLNEKWQIANEIDFMQSGLDGLTTTTYGISIRTGVKYTW